MKNFIYENWTKVYFVRGCVKELYFSAPDEQNVSDEIAEALMRSVIKNIRQTVRNPKDYNARSNLFWAALLSENRLIKLGKKSEDGISLLEDFIREIGLPTTLRELGIRDQKLLKQIADSDHYSPGRTGRWRQRRYWRYSGNAFGFVNLPLGESSREFVVD